MKLSNKCIKNHPSQRIIVSQNDDFLVHNLFQLVSIICDHADSDS